jgi:hypothetical protein
VAFTADVLHRMMISLVALAQSGSVCCSVSAAVTVRAGPEGRGANGIDGLCGVVSCGLLDARSACLQLHSQHIVACCSNASWLQTVV